MARSQLKIDIHYFGEQLAGAMNDVGFGDSEDAEWFIDELFHRLKRSYYGYAEVYGDAPDGADALLDVNHSDAKVDSNEE